MQRVLVTDGEERAALAIVRSLGNAGYETYVSSPRSRSLAGASRYCRADAVVPDPLTAPAEYVSAVRDLVDRWQVGVLLPVTEASLLAILGERGAFDDVCLPCPTLEAFTRISDKQAVLEAAAALGIAVPRQVVIATPDQRTELDRASLDYPVVLKPARSIGEGRGRRTKQRVCHAFDESQLSVVLDELPPEAYPLLVQRRVVGPGVGVFMLRWNGDILAVSSHRRIREKPPAGGVSVYRESIRPDPRLVEQSKALLERFDWSGVAMVEFKVERGSDTPYLMEVNGRFWGSLQLAIDAGVNFPVLLLAAAVGTSQPGVNGYETGIRSRWWWGEVDHLWARLRRSKAHLGLLETEPGRWSAAREFLTLWRRGDRAEVFRFGDPKPFVRETIDWFRRR